MLDYSNQQGWVHIHECLVSRQAVFLNIKLISIITAYTLSHDRFQWKQTVEKYRQLISNISPQNKSRRVLC